MLGTGALDLDLAAGDGDRGDVRGGLDAVGHGVMVTGRSEPRSTPSITSVEVPTPSISRAHRDQELAEVGDLGFAGGVVDRRVGRRRARPRSSGSPSHPRSGSRSVMSAPCSRSANASTYPWLNLNVAPIASRPLTCMSIGREPKSSPPGSDKRTWPQRVSSGPSTLIDARMRSTSSYGATGVRSPVSVSSSRSGDGRSIVDADGLQQIAHDGDVGDRRHVRELEGAVGQAASPPSA